LAPDLVVEVEPALSFADNHARRLERDLVRPASGEHEDGKEGNGKGWAHGPE
jgi:hypothetical protein